MTVDRPLHVWMPNIRGNSGSDVYVERLASGLRKRGMLITVDWFDPRYEFFPDLLRFAPRPPAVDIIHATSLNAFAFRRHRLPLVVTEHHFVLDPAYRPFKTLTQHVYQLAVSGRASRRSFSSASVVVSPSRFTQRALENEAPGVAQAMIPLWVDLDRFTPDRGLASISRHPAPPFRLLFVGNASYRKGADVLVPLAERLGHGFEIAYTGGLRGGLENVAGTSMRRLGRLSDDELIQAYRECDAVLVPSRYEGFGYAALEAMACGKPVVAFSCGAVDEIVLHGETGFMVPIDDLRAMEAAVRKLHEDPVRAAQMGAAGRARAEASFSEGKGIDAYMALYDELRCGNGVSDSP